MRQLFLDEYLKKKDGEKIPDKLASQIRIINWNIAHPSLTRAHKIADWLGDQEINILTLTETSDSPGCTFLHNRLESFGFKVMFPKKEKDFGAILAFRDFEAQEFKTGLNFLTHRAPAIICNTPVGEVGIISVYVPSSVSRNETYGKKQKFQDEFTKVLASVKKTKRPTHIVVCGDLNVLEPNHHPRYPFIRDWEYQFYESFKENGLVDAYRLFYPDVCEYSWYGREGYGYRYDHCFVSKGLKKHTKTCQYLHEPRKDRLSDHSVMLLHLDLKGR